MSSFRPNAVRGEIPEGGAGLRNDIRSWRVKSTAWMKSSLGRWNKIRLCEFCCGDKREPSSRAKSRDPLRRSNSTLVKHPPHTVIQRVEKPEEWQYCAGYDGAVLTLSTPTTLLSHYTRFILVLSKDLPQFLLLFFLISSLFLSLTLLFLFSFFLFIIVIICYIYKFLLFFTFINSQHQLGDLSTTLEMTVLFL